MRIKSKLILASGILFILLIFSQLSFALELKLLWKKEISPQIDRFSFAENLEYIAVDQRTSGAEVTDETEEAVRKAIVRYHGCVADKSGNIILEGRARVSENGKTAVIYGSEKTKVYKLPEKILKCEYPIKKEIPIGSSDLSYDGNIIIIFLLID